MAACALVMRVISISPDTITDMTIILQDNSEAIRKQIKDAGIKLCCCTSFADACWLDYHPNITDSVHGVGHYGEDAGTKSQEEELIRFMSECQEPIICKDVSEFIERIKATQN